MTRVASTYEAGIAPLVIAGVSVSYSTIFWTVANVGLTAYQINQIWGSGAGAVNDAESSARQEDLEQCMQMYGADMGMTPSSRALFIADLDNWRAYAQKELAGDQVKLAAANKTIDSLANLYAQDVDPAGLPVGPCHVMAGSFIITRQIAAMKFGIPLTDTGAQEELVASSPQPRGARSLAPLAIAAAVGVVSYMLVR